MRSSTVPYEDSDQKLRICYRKLNEMHDRGIATREHVAIATAIVFHDQMHFLAPFRPNDGIILPEGGHFHVLLIDALLVVDHGAGAAVAILLTLVGDVTLRPSGGLAACVFLDHVGADVDGAVAIIHRV
jgi:hypothetical protein